VYEAEMHEADAMIKSIIDANLHTDATPVSNTARNTARGAIVHRRKHH
jgi:hypothetical protein